MSFRDRRENKAELRPPDAKRSKGDRPISPAVAQNSNIPVFERRKMFEQTDSGLCVEKPAVGSSGKRRLTVKSQIGRSGSFRGSKKFKGEGDGSPQLRARQISGASLPLSQRLRYFGHYDLQSAAIERLTSEKALTSDHAVKKATGASAAHGAREEESGDGVSNDLVAACPAFKNEVGGDSDWLDENNPVLRLRSYLSHDKQKRIASREGYILDGDIPGKEAIGARGPPSRQASEVFQRQSELYFPLEFIDYGAAYYRNYFLGHDHQNFFGVDELLGPVAISVKRERVPDELPEFYGIPASVGPTGMPKHQYRVILRTSELATLRGVVLEDAIPSGTKAGTARGLPPRDVLEYLGQGELQLSSFKLGKPEKKVFQEVVRLDEQELNNKYKIGVLYCKKGQTTEEDMYNNEQGSAAFEDFLSLLGKKVKMKGFTKYRAQLDNKTDTTGEYSIYTEFRDTEVMFHVSTLLPYTSSNRQQLLRKRHIGNDIVTVIFQEEGCEPFSPRCIRSHFQHIFVVVRVEKSNTQYPKYRVAVTRTQDIPYFGPSIPEGAVFDKDDQFRDFLLAKLINACNASLRSEKFSGMAIRTRKQYLTDLAENSTTGLNIDQANNSGIVAGFLARNWGGRKRERVRQQGPLLYTPGALTWNVSIILRGNKPLPFSEDHDFHLDCILALGPDLLVFLSCSTKETILNIPTHDVCGWLQERRRLNIFYDDCYCVSLEAQDGEEDLRDIAHRLQATAPKLTPSHEATLMEFHRGRNGLLGFGINEVGVVQKVDGLAKSIGLQTNSRLLQVEDRLLCCYTHSQIMELLTARGKQFVKAYVVPPPPNQCRRLLHYPTMNWNAIWASRPSHNGDSEEHSCEVGHEPMDTSEPVVLLRVKPRKISNTSRHSYIEAMQSGGMAYDDDEPLYDRLLNLSPPLDKAALKDAHPTKVPQPHHKDNLGYLRVRRAPKALRESVVNFADDLMERKLRGESLEPEPIDHTIDVYSPRVRTQLSSSTVVPGSKPHKVAPLSLRHKKTGSVDQIRVTMPMDIGSPKSDVPHTPGQVQEMAKRFSFGSPTTPTGGKGVSKIPVAAAHQPGTPMKATGTTAEMTKSSVPVRAITTPVVIPSGDSQPSEGDVQLRSGKRSYKMRPASWDVSLIFNADNVRQPNKDDATSDTAFDNSQSFTRNSNIRTPIRKKLPSREFSPDVNSDETPPSTPGRQTRDSDTPYMENIPHGSSETSEKRNDKHVSVRERTKVWEARGGGLPSYFATLPNSFKHKASQSPTGQSQIPRRNTVAKDVSGRSRNSVTGIPQSVTGTHSPRNSVPLIATKSQSSRTPSQSFHREEADGASNPDIQVGEGGSAVTNGDVESKAPTVIVGSPVGHQPVIKSKGVSAAVSKSRGQSLLPTKTLIATSTSHPAAQDNFGDKAIRKSSQSPDRGSNIPRSGSNRPSTGVGLQVGSGYTSEHTAVERRLSAPCSANSHNHSSRDKSVSPVGQTIPAHFRQKSGELAATGNSSLENGTDTMGLSEGVQGLTLTDHRPRARSNPPEKSSRSRKSHGARNPHIEEWIRQTNESAVAPELLHSESLARDNISSPTFTDGSFGQMSDHSQEMIDSLKQKIDFLESRLEKESESNTELKHKMRHLERQLESKQNRYHKGIKTAII